MRGVAVGNASLHPAVSGLSWVQQSVFACLFTALLIFYHSRASTRPLRRPTAIITIPTGNHTHIPWSGPIVRIKTPAAVFSRHGVFPRPPDHNTWHNNTTSPVVRTKRVTTSGRHKLHQVLGVVVQRYLLLASDGQAGEVRQVRVDGNENQDASCSTMGSAIVKPQDFERQDDVVIQAHIRHFLHASMHAHSAERSSCREHMAPALSHSSGSWR